MARKVLYLLGMGFLIISVLLIFQVQEWFIYESTQWVHDNLQFISILQLLTCVFFLAGLFLVCMGGRRR